MAHIDTVPVESIDHNPFRDISKYPLIARKIDTLKRSIADVGLWEGIIVRQVGNRYELAFGHHRFEAAKQSGLAEIPVIVRDLTEDQMLGFMGRENMDDYNADFLTMLETWEAAWAWLSATRVVDKDEPLEVAVLLGWTRPRSDNTSKVQMSRTAGACHAARKLILDDRVPLTRADLMDLNVNQAREICERAQANIERIVSLGKTLGTSPAHITQAKEVMAKAVKTTAEQSRNGEVAQKDLRSRVDVNAYQHAQSFKAKDTPLFEVFGKQLAEGIRKMLNGDAASEKLDEVLKLLPSVHAPEDNRTVLRLGFELQELEDRARRYRGKLAKIARSDDSPNVVSLARVVGGADA
jgi:ParB-like chromosome segregation protein Spo0J